MWITESNPVPLSLRNMPQVGREPQDLTSCGLQGFHTSPGKVLGFCKKEGPSAQCFLPAALAGRGHFFFKSPGDSAVGGLSSDSEVKFMSFIIFISVLSCLLSKKKTSRKDFTS